MRYRVIDKLYVDDKLIDPTDPRYASVEVGDGCDIQWRYPVTSPRVDSNGFPIKSPVKAGDPMPPSRALLPLDDEAKQMWKDHYGEDHLGEEVVRDPTLQIPISGVQAAEAKAKAEAKAEAAKPRVPEGVKK